MNIKETLDKYLSELNAKEFIANDPIQFPRRFTDIRDIEISAFVTSCLAFGNRKQIIKKCEELHQIMGDSPYEFINNGGYMKWYGNHNKFYRFYDYHDLYMLFDKLDILYTAFGTLKSYLLYKEGVTPTDALIHIFKDCYIIPNDNKSACKRLNMFLRWLVRKDSIDLGVWNFIDTKDLLIPLDVHVARIARSLGLLTRKQDDMKAVIELTDNLKKFDANDPVKYDLVLFSLGIDNK